MRPGYEKKATKIEVLDFIHMREVVTAYDLVAEFGYTYQSAWDRLKRLRRARLIEPLILRGTYGITELAAQKLDHYGRL